MSAAALAEGATHRPWHHGARGMGLLTPEALRQRIHEVEASKEVRWLFEPHEVQAQILAAPERFLCAACGRRTGKSVCAVRWLTEEVGRTQGLGWWAAPTYKTGMRAGWANLIQLLPRPYRRVYTSEKRIELTGGGVIEMVSCDNPDSLRGAGLHALVVDEAAFVSDYVWQQVLRQMLSDHEGRLLAIGTPNGKRGWFYRAWLRGQSGDPADADYHSWQAPSSANPYLKASEIEEMRESLPDRVFRQEVLAEFIDDASAVFRGVRLACTAKRPTLYIPGRCVFGVDWGRSNDYTVVAVIDTKTRAMIELERFSGIGYELQVGRLQALYDKWRPTQIVAEYNSMGGPLVERLQRLGLPVEAFTTTNASKGTLIEQLSLAIERRTVELLEEEWLINELLSYEMQRTPSGAVTYNAPAGLHDDGVMATALSVRALDGDPTDEDGRADAFFGDAVSYLLSDPIASALAEERQRWVV